MDKAEAGSERPHANENNNAFDAVLLKALGRLPVEQKKLFLVQAKDCLLFMSEANRNRQWAPDEAHHEALVNLANKSRALKLALERTELSGVPEWYMREAWAIATNIHDAPGEPFPNRLPTILWHLYEAARIWLPDPNPKHAPVKDDIESTVIKVLAAEFHSAFGKKPTVGAGSPFVKFCDSVLPEHGFSAPSATKVRRILGI